MDSDRNYLPDRFAFHAQTTKERADISEHRIRYRDSTIFAIIDNCFTIILRCRVMVTCQRFPTKRKVRARVCVCVCVKKGKKASETKMCGLHNVPSRKRRFHNGARGEEERRSLCTRTQSVGEFFAI